MAWPGSLSSRRSRRSSDFLYQRQQDLKVSEPRRLMVTGLLYVLPVLLPTHVVTVKRSAIRPLQRQTHSKMEPGWCTGRLRRRSLTAALSQIAKESDRDPRSTPIAVYIVRSGQASPTWSVDVHRHRSEGRRQRQPASVFVCRMRIRQRWLRFRVRRGSDRASLRDRVQHDHSGPALVSARILHRSDHVNRRTVKDFYVDICAPPDDGREQNRQVSSNVIESPSFNREPPKIMTSCPTA